MACLTPFVAAEIADAMQGIYARGLTTASGGNISMRHGETISITAAGVDKGRAAADDIALITLDGTHVSGPRPSSECPFHIAVYQARPDIRAVVHAHPISLVAYSLVDNGFDTGVFPSCYQVCGTLGRVAYWEPGTSRLGEMVADCFRAGHDCVLMQNHGIVIGGQSIRHAVRRIEVLEATASSLALAQELGVDTESFSDRFRGQPPGNVSSAADVVLRTVDRPPDPLISRKIIETARRCHNQGLIQAGRGAIAVRASAEHWLVAVASDFGQLTENDLQTYAMPRDRRASDAHRGLGAVAARAAPDADSQIGEARIHAYPPAATAFGLASLTSLPTPIPESYLALGQVPILGRQLGGISPLLLGSLISPDQPVAVLARDGSIASGRSLLEAFDRLEVLEASATAVLRARRLGAMRLLSDQELAALEAKRQKSTIRAAARDRHEMLDPSDKPSA